LSLHLTTLAPIRKLPPFHGAHWSALFRNLLRPHAVGAEAEGLWVVPAPGAPVQYEAGESIRLGLVFPPEMIGAVSAALIGFNGTVCGTGHFQPGVTVRLDKVLCRISGDTWNPFAANILTEELMQPEIERLCELDQFRICITTPLRLTRPAGEKEQGHRYCDAAYFHNSDSSDNQKINALLCRVRHSAFPEPAASPLRLTDVNLGWQEVSYGNSYMKNIGGIIGEMTVAGHCNRETAEQLVAGQYYGAGKNAAFGFGFYTIPELDAVRQVSALSEKRTIALNLPGCSVWADAEGLTIAAGPAERQTVCWGEIGAIVVDPEYPPPPGVINWIMRKNIPLRTEPAADCFIPSAGGGGH